MNPKKQPPPPDFDEMPVGGGAVTLNFLNEDAEEVVVPPRK